MNAFRLIYLFNLLIKIRFQELNIQFPVQTGSVNATLPPREQHANTQLICTFAPTCDYSTVLIGWFVD